MLTMSPLASTETSGKSRAEEFCFGGANLKYGGEKVGGVKEVALKQQ